MAFFKVLFVLALSVYMANAVGVISPFDGYHKIPDLDEEKERDSKVDWYDCSGKADGNYIHPTDCTKFMSCVAQTHAYERNCAECHVHPDTCPTGRTHYDHPADACLWANEAGCVTDPGDSGEIPDPEPTPDPNPDPEDCDPDDCQVEGDCHEYWWCEREASDHKGRGKKGEKRYEICDPAHNLYFNPNRNDVHGGVCDFWENLDQATKDKYNADPTCIDPHCEWKPDPDNECSSKYWYFHPEQNNGEDQEMHCPQRPDGEQLIWDQTRKSCHVCSSVQSSSGPCC